MAAIRDLTPGQLARHAFNVFLFSGRDVIGARLTYRALSMDNNEPLGLRCLSDLMDRDPLQMYSAAALEYGVSPSTTMAAGDRTRLDDHLFFSKWCWGFSKHVSGSSELSGADFARREDFALDEASYRAWFNELLAPAGSLGNAYHSALRLVGIMGGLVQHRTLGMKGGLDDLVRDDLYELTPFYAQWSASSTDDLDLLEERRQRETEQ